MTDDPTPEPAPDDDLIIEIPATRFYANAVRTLPGIIDLAVDFGYQGGAGMEWPIRIVMTWEEARVLHGFLENALRIFETAAGGPVRDIEGLGPLDDPGLGSNGHTNGDTE